MTVKFNGLIIPGTHSSVVESAPKLQVNRTFFWGLNGASEIVGGESGRQLEIEIWIHNKFFFKKNIDVFLSLIDRRVGVHGDLTVILPVPAAPAKKPSLVKPYSRVYKNVTFEQFERVALPGQSAPAPTPDYAGTVDGGWFQPGRLLFHQLSLANEPSPPPPKGKK